MKKNQSKTTKFIIIGIIAILGIIGIYKGITFLIYKQTYEYKLLKVGYQKESVPIIIENLNEKTINYLLTIEYNDKINEIIKDPYFIEENLEKYLNYQKVEESKNIRDIVAIINVGADKEFYTDPKPTNTNIDKNLILVNKFYYLDKSYTPENIVPISLMYAYDNNHIEKSIYGSYISLWNAAKKEGLTLISASSYRSFEAQDDLYKSFINSLGQEEADLISAKPGHSEHQLGLVIDISAYGRGLEKDFEETDEFKWLKDNAHKYGFILRYPKDKTYLTGYDYEPWHYRYVGKEVAEYIYNKNITFDEYYAYYLGS